MHRAESFRRRESYGAASNVVAGSPGPKTPSMCKKFALACVRLHDLTRLVSDWTWETNRDLVITNASPRIHELLGIHPWDVVGRRLDDLPTTCSPRLKKVVAEGGCAPFRDIEVEAKAASGRLVTLLLSGLPVYDPEDGKFMGLVGIARDITKPRERERELVDARERAELGDRVKTEFLAQMSHELRTPLNAVIGFSEVLESELLGPLPNEQYKSYVSDIHDSAISLLRTINDILDWASVGPGDFQLVERELDPRAIIDAAVRILSAHCTTITHRLEYDLPKQAVKIRADERMMIHVVSTLLSNAMDLTPPTGSVHISVEGGPDGSLVFVAKGAGQIASRSENDRALSLHRNPDRVSRDLHRAGLGLPLSRAFLHLHGGDLALDTGSGKTMAAIAKLPSARVIGQFELTDRTRF